MVVIETNLGTIKLELDHQNTPNTAKNFLRYAEEGFFDNTLFHRVIDGFMIQGGGFEPGMSQKSTHEPIENEADKGGSNKRGTIAMARTSDPHSATSQFFINVADNAFLDHKAKTGDAWGYCVFGHVTDGMDIIDKIKSVDTTARAGHQDVPAKDVVIEKITVVDKEQ
ncbi:peptidylprolyl isomerase [Candidiatus Paracoxiella cheracis]|uniref:peptidylprolyl isomerase n=1 Tax=Candidiatus Paracoxiella cheracis TaxID=3405120 RepID=UPI003BF603AF